MSARVPFQRGPMPIDPRISNIGLDANALDLNGSDRDELVKRFRKMSGNGELTVLVPAGVRGEVMNPRTPSDVQDAVLPQIFNLRPGLNSDQQCERRRVAAILQGNADKETHAADASHLSEAAEMGCCYFITQDNRMLKKRDELRAAMPPTLQIVTLEEFFDIVYDFEEGRR